jgi:hypothetical protein
MGLFGFLREAFEPPQSGASATVPTLPPSVPIYDPVIRLLAQGFVRGLMANNDVTYDDAWTRLFHLPIHSVALIDSPAGQVALAQQMGLSPRVTVH